MRIHQVEALKGKRGYLTLTLLTIDSFDREEYLLFSAIDNQGMTVEQETCEKLFNCMATSNSVAVEIPQQITQRLTAAVQRHIQATISKSLETNNRFFNEAREKLEKWADDMILSAEKALKIPRSRSKSRSARRDWQTILTNSMKSRNCKNSSADSVRRFFRWKIASSKNAMR